MGLRRWWWWRRRSPLVGRENWERELDGDAGPGTHDWALTDPINVRYGGEENGETRLLPDGPKLAELEAQRDEEH